MIRRIKVFINKRIERAVKRELTKIFKQDGDVAIDHHIKQNSWAVIKVDTGSASCYLKFIDLGKKDLKEIQHFLNKFDRSHIDSMPQVEIEFNKMKDLFEL